MSQTLIHTKQTLIIFCWCFRAKTTFWLISIDSYLQKADSWCISVNVFHLFCSPHRLLTCRQPKPAQTRSAKLEHETESIPAPTSCPVPTDSTHSHEESVYTDYKHSNRQGWKYNLLWGYKWSSTVVLHLKFGAVMTGNNVGFLQTHQQILHHVCAGADNNSFCTQIRC